MGEIEFGGEKRPVNFGWAAIREFSKSTGVDFGDDEALKNLNIDSVFYLIYVGLKHGARIGKKEFPYTIDDIGDFLDKEDDFVAKIEEFTEMLTEQMPKPKKVTAP